MSESRIALVPMKQLAEARTKDDDWTGITDLTARKKRQARLSKRLQRRRKERQTQPTRSSEFLATEESSDLHHSAKLLREPLCQTVQVVRCSQTPQVSRVSGISSLSYPPWCNNDPKITGSGIWFPLTADNLINLIEFNVYRAFLTNMSLLGKMPACKSAPRVGTSLAPFEFPPSLHPTAVQLKTPHPSWMDMFPLPALRDNLILSQGFFDEKDMCMDMLGGLFYARCGNEKKGLIIWREPWDVNGWEVTDGFAVKWGFLLKGCDGLLEATNRWRDVRGEERLFLKS